MFGTYLTILCFYSIGNGSILNVNLINNLKVTEASDHQNSGVHVSGINSGAGNISLSIGAASAQ